MDTCLFSSFSRELPGSQCATMAMGSGGIEAERLGVEMTETHMSTHGYVYVKQQNILIFHDHRLSSGRLYLYNHQVTSW